MSAVTDVTITSAPVGAAVFEGMALLGKTPLTLIWDKATERSLTLRADGFDEETLVLSTGDGSPVQASYEVKMVPVQPSKSVKPKSRKSRKGAKRKKRPRWKDFEQ